MRPHALGPDVEHFLVGRLEQLVLVVAEVGIDDAEDVLVLERLGVAVILEVAVDRDAVAALGQGELFRREQRLQFGLGPAVEFALLALTVGVLGGVKTAVLMAHVAQDVAENVAGDVGVLFLAADEVGVEVEVQKLRVVVEHFLEVRHEPFFIDRVAGEAAADLVVHAAGRHLVARVQHHADAVPVACAVGVAQQHQRQAGPGELGRVAEAAEARVVLGLELGDSAVEPSRIELDVGLGLERDALADALADVVGRGEHICALRLPRVGDLIEDVGETRFAELGHRRKVSAAVKRLEVGREPDVEWPAAAAGRGLHEGHIDFVHVGPLLAVKFDADEMLVHHLGGRFILERLTLHHVAPVAGRVADTQQDWFLLVARFFERLFAPGVPIDRVVFVLLQVGRRLIGETVGVFRLGFLLGRLGFGHGFGGLGWGELGLRRGGGGVFGCGAWLATGRCQASQCGT